MKANELRIGNYILNHDELHAVGIWHLQILNSIQQNYFKPIPLTEEWLVKFSFKQDLYKTCYSLGKLSVNIPDKNYKFGRVYFNSWAIKEESPKFVHELMNLYFALTGQELTISE